MIHAFVGDGVCNDETNIAGCNFDGGDCCGYNITSEHCTDCTCFKLETCLAGVIHAFVGDGVCNDETNIAECDYDGGDCCGYTVNTDFCFDCKCYINETCVAGTHPLLGDGFCNDETNNPDCNYDGGDCCAMNANTNSCSECVCLLIETCASGYHPLVGNGFCNDDTNIAECDNDGGDCCLDYVYEDYCDECLCLE